MIRRWVRRIGIVYLAACALFFIMGAVAAAADAATTAGTNVTNYLDHVPAPYIAGILIGAGIIPMLSAIATSHPGVLTGLWTAALSLLDAVLTAVAHAGDDNWRHVAAAAVSTWVGAIAVHSKILKKRDANDQPRGLEALLHSIGVVPRVPLPPPANPSA